jgi:hypothetical protein
MPLEGLLRGLPSLLNISVVLEHHRVTEIVQVLHCSTSPLDMMKVSGVLLFFGAFLQGAFAQQEFLNKLPACAVCYAHATSPRPSLIRPSVKMCPRNCVDVRMLSQRLRMPVCRHGLHEFCCGLQCG